MDDSTPVSELKKRAGSLRVALVHDWLVSMRGGERVFEHLCEMFPQADVYTLLHEPAALRESIRRMNVIESGFFASAPAAVRSRYRWFLPLFPRLIEAFPTEKHDLIVSTSHCVAKGVHPPKRGLHASYVFSPMRYVWDHFDDYLSNNSFQNMALRLMRRRLQDWDRRTAQFVDTIAADSAHIGGKVRRFWERRAEVIHPPVDSRYFTPDESVQPENHFLIVSALVPYKRIDRAIEAAELAGRRLVVIGDGPERGRLQSVAGSLVELQGWQPRSKIRDAYRRCQALLYPGCEDFGITALEAQACGRPVLALRQGGAMETVVAGETGEFFNDPTAESLADLLTDFDSSHYSLQACRKQAEGFSEEIFRSRMAGWILREGDGRCW